MVVIIDDDLAVREATSALLKSIGHATRTFASGEDFLASGCIDDTACLITDVKMNGMSGVELQMRLRQAGHRVPIIFITAFPDEGEQAQALAAGAHGFLTKPCRQEHLIACLTSALAGPA